MTTKFKLFSVCCGMILAGILTTQDSKAEGSDTNDIYGECVGQETICFTYHGAVFYGVWRGKIE